MRQQLVRSVVVLLLLCTAQLASAQSHKDVVADVVNDLRARGVDIGGPCGALAIVKRVAWRLRAEGAGLLFKNTGNNCEERAVDIVVYPDGHGFDVLTGSGDPNGNGADWSTVAIDSGASRWRGVAVDPDAGVVTTPPTNPTPPSVPVQTLNLQPALDGIAASEGRMLQRIAEAESEAKNRADATTKAVNERADKTDQKIDELREAATGGLRDFGMFVLKYVVPAVGAAVAGMAVAK